MTGINIHTWEVVAMVMKRYNVYLSEELISRLQEVYRETGVRPAELIRRAVEEWLDSHPVGGDVGDEGGEDEA